MGRARQLYHRLDDLLDVYFLGKDIKDEYARQRAHEREFRNRKHLPQTLKSIGMAERVQLLTGRYLPDAVIFTAAALDIYAGKAGANLNWVIAAEITRWISLVQMYHFRRTSQKDDLIEKELRAKDERIRELSDKLDNEGEEWRHGRMPDDSYHPPQH